MNSKYSSGQRKYSALYFTAFSTSLSIIFCPIISRFWHHHYHHLSFLWPVRWNVNCLLSCKIPRNLQSAVFKNQHKEIIMTDYYCFSVLSSFCDILFINVTFIVVIINIITIITIFTNNIIIVFIIIIIAIIIIFIIKLSLLWLLLNQWYCYHYY